MQNLARIFALPARQQQKTATTGLKLTSLPGNRDPEHVVLCQTLNNPFLVEPNEESEQWVAAIVHDRVLDHRVAHKERFGDQQVRVSLARSEPASISVLVTNALFAGDAQQRLLRAGVSHIWSTDSISRSSNLLHLVQPLAKALGECGYLRGQ